MKILYLDPIINEFEVMMTNAQRDIDSDPDAMLHYSMARMLKSYLLKEYALQEGQEFTGEWEHTENGDRCSVCWMPRKRAELDGTCVSCGAKMKGRS